MSNCSKQEEQPENKDFNMIKPEQKRKKERILVFILGKGGM
jgi:hypothetical protein